MALDVSHGLPLDLQPIPYPHVAHDLVEGSLKVKESELMISTAPTFVEIVIQFLFRKSHKMVKVSFFFIICSDHLGTRVG